VSAVVERANPRGIPGPLLALCGVLIAIGVISFLFGVMNDPQTTWLSFHVNFLYFGSMAQGGLALACALSIVGAKWAGPVRHVAASLAAWVPVTLVLCLVSWAFGGEYIFANWWHGAPPPKEHWLTPGRVYGTDVAILAVLTLLSYRFIKADFRPACHGAAEKSTGWAKKRFESWTRDWHGDDAEQAASKKKLGVLAPVTALVFAFGYGMIGFDQVMSLTPTWFSNIFCWYFAWGGFLCGITMTALVCVLLRQGPGWREEIDKPRMHDMGKMIWAFSIFWMYLFFAQYIVVWYGNLPEETQFYMMRLGSQFLQDTWHWDWVRLDEPYVKLSLSAWLCIWVIPFWVLIGQRFKKTPIFLGGMAALSLFGFWLERNALVFPSLAPDDGMAWAGAIQFGLALGFLGAFALVHLVFTRVFPTLPLPVRD
jgi:hypothetical protein